MFLFGIDDEEIEAREPGLAGTTQSVLRGPLFRHCYYSYWHYCCHRDRHQRTLMLMLMMMMMMMMTLQHRERTLV